MISRAGLATAALFLAGCNLNAGGPSLHHPDLSLSEVARNGEADSRVFTSYNAKGPVRWNQGWPWKFDLTGIGWDVSTAVTAITPRHVVMANHYQRETGGKAVFHDRNGRPHTRTVIKVLHVQGDVALGLLDRPLPKSIRTYPLPEISTENMDELAGAQVLVTEQKRRLYFHQIKATNGTFVRFQYDTRLDESKKKRLISGDSGNPSFLLSKGELVLIETHSSGGPGAGPFYGNPEVIAALRKTLSQLDPGYQLRTITIDKKVMKEAREARALMPKPTTPTRSQTTPQPSPSNTTTPSSRTPRPRLVRPPSQ
ncbi:hypothetical protein [Haloferula sp.]|uniref:hypothetical protein n=1 Tax=Haloferula sp. TaxID=2497595 RepID=UPI00329F0466